MGLVSYFMACSYPSSCSGVPLHSYTPCIELELRDHPFSHSAMAEFGGSLSLAYAEALWGLIRRGRTRWSARIPRSISRVCLAFYYLHHSSPILRNHTHHVYSAGPPVSGYLDTWFAVWGIGLHHCSRHAVHFHTYSRRCSLKR